MKDLGRLLTAMITPFHEDESVHYDEAARLAQWLVSEGNDGVIVSGTTGESPTLDAEEKLELFRRVKNALGVNGTVIAGTGSNDTRSSVALTKAATQCGVDGILAVVPYYNKPTQDGLLRHFGAIAEATPLPIIVYNVPGRTMSNLSPSTLLELARRYANIVGVKESSGDFQQFTAILRDRPAGFRFWSGDDPLFLPSLAIGGEGLISVAGHLCARELRAILTAMDAGDVASAAHLHQSLAELFSALFCTSSPIPVKWAMQQAGFAAGPARSPLSPLPTALHSQVATAIGPYVARIGTPVAR